MALLAAAIATAPQSLAGVGPGQDCSHGVHAASVKCVNGQNNERYYGGYDDFVDVVLQTSSSTQADPRHVNQEMWLYTHSDQSQWVELGLRKGWWINCACDTYVRFWADFDTARNEHRHTISYPPSYGSEHTYEILRDSTDHNYWDVYVDYNYKGQSTVQSSATGYEIENGLEDTDVDTTTYSDLANHSPLEYLNATGAWVHYPYDRSWVDSPCAGTTTGPYCLTGYNAGSNDVWKAAKGH